MSLAVAVRDRKSALRPAAVAVHDDRDAAGVVGRFEVGGDLILHFGFFVLHEVVDRLRVLVGQLLHLSLAAALLVVADLAVADELLEVLHHVAANVPDRDLALLAVLAHELDELLAPLLRQLRDRQADQLAVVGRRQAESDSCTAFSIALICVGSNGCTVRSRGSGTPIVAMFFSGVAVP